MGHTALGLAATSIAVYSPTLNLAYLNQDKEKFQERKSYWIYICGALRCWLFNQYPCAHWVSSIILLKHKKLIHAVAGVAGLLDQILIFRGFQTCAVQLWWALIPAWNWVSVVSVGRSCSLVAGRRSRDVFQGCDLAEASRLQEKKAMCRNLPLWFKEPCWIYVVETLVTSLNPGQVDAT